MSDQRSLPACIAKLTKPVDDVEIVREAAEAIRRALERIHGAPFKTLVNHDVCLVMVNRDR